MAATFHHIGVPTARVGRGETYIAGGKVHVTDPAESPYRIEFLRFEPDTPLPAILRAQCHAAFVVESIEAALAGQEVVVEPFAATPEVRVAFLKVGDALIEVMEMKEGPGDRRP